MLSSHRFLQTNLNHSARAQDLLIQSLAEWLIDVSIVAEPYFIPTQDNWIGDVEGSVAIICSGAVGTPSLIVKAKGVGYIAASYGDYTIIGVYFSPNKVLAEFEIFLNELETVVRQSQSHLILVAGDFNAKSTAWGSPATDSRGKLLEEWAIVTDLLILNKGSVNTCVRRQGGSIIDVSFASPVIARSVQEWTVLDGVETLSDHLYIRFDIVSSPINPGNRSRGYTLSLSPKWALKRLNKDALVEASVVQAWIADSNRPEVAEVEQEADWFRKTMTIISDAAMPRVKHRPPRRQVYWWNDEISKLRLMCSAARRQYTRYRRRRYRVVATEMQLYEQYKQQKHTLQNSISKAKAQAREELLETLNSDPWGRPYHMVRNKIRSWAPPVTQSLQPLILEDVVSTLFPSRMVHTPPTMSTSHLDENDVDGVPAITQVELGMAVRRLRNKKKAPGPDGIHGRVWALAFNALGERLCKLFNKCLHVGKIPRQWKSGGLVLLRKPGRPLTSPSAYRPIVLLDEVGKLFERVIAARIVEHMRDVGPDLSEFQYGFREGRSTLDAILHVKALSDEMMSSGGVLIAVSLDIKNAFNTLPWSCILEALKYHKVPLYLRRMIGSYLSDRHVTCLRQDNIQMYREMTCGVPQGSVLGPLLWNIGYDWVLRGVLLPGVSITCYADDTLVTARGKTYKDSARLATVGVAQVVGRIRMLGLEVALAKSEALCFHGPRAAPPCGSSIIVSGIQIEVGSSIKYLGLILDSRWDFCNHFRRLAPRLMQAASILSRLLPNLRGPENSCRRLYAGVVRSMALYGAPIWASAMTEKLFAIIRPIQRVLAVRVIRGYRTISYEAACILAGTPPWDLEAEVHASVYNWRMNMQSRGECPPPAAVVMQRSCARRVLLEKWSERLKSPKAGIRTVEAVRPILLKWIDRRHGQLTYRLTQVLTGHGCFGKYLCQTIAREPTTKCHHCVGCINDTAQHTLEECPAWDNLRLHLTAAVGDDLSLSAVVTAMVERERSWQAVLTFCETVMSLKEEAERLREDDPSSLPLRRKRTGRRQRDFILRLPPP